MMFDARLHGADLLHRESTSGQEFGRQVRAAARVVCSSRLVADIVEQRGGLYDVGICSDGRCYLDCDIAHAKCVPGIVSGRLTAQPLSYLFL